jgi:hypothetical protein
MVESTMGASQQKSHGQRLFMICDGKCDRDFFLVLLVSLDTMVMMFSLFPKPSNNSNKTRDLSEKNTHIALYLLY